MWVCVPLRPESLDSLEGIYKWLWTSWHQCQELNSGHLQEQYMLLSTEPSLQPQYAELLQKVEKCFTGLESWQWPGKGQCGRKGSGVALHLLFLWEPWKPCVNLMERPKCYWIYRAWTGDCLLSENLDVTLKMSTSWPPKQDLQNDNTLWRASVGGGNFTRSPHRWGTTGNQWLPERRRISFLQGYRLTSLKWSALNIRTHEHY